MLMDLFKVMHEDAQKLAAGDLHELMRCWEMTHRLWTVEAHCRHIQFREESRYPGFYYRADFPKTNDEEWFCFTNSKYDPATGEWTCKKEPYHKIIPD
jgi:adenylylsulfate reductase subunit A